MRDKNSFFVNENQLKEWVSAAGDLRDCFDVEKALGYVIGEKFYNVLSDVLSSQERVEFLQKEQRKPDYNPVRTYSFGKFGESTENFDESCEHYKKRAEVGKVILEEFAGLIRETFEPHEIRAYFISHPRLGAMGHTASEAEHAFMAEQGMVERTAETEAKDALLLDEIKNYFDH